MLCLPIKRAGRTASSWDGSSRDLSDKPCNAARIVVSDLSYRAECQARIRSVWSPLEAFGKASIVDEGLSTRHDSKCEDCKGDSEETEEGNVASFVLCFKVLGSAGEYRCAAHRDSNHVQKLPIGPRLTLDKED